MASVIDVGASNGNWSLKVRKFFPDAFFFMVEAQKTHERALEKVKKAYRSFDYVIAAAGANSGQIYFDGSDPFGGVASFSPLEKNCIMVPVNTIDTLVAERKLKPPYLLKLDTHGFEIPILAGAQETLRQTELIIVETYNFSLTSETLRFHQLSAWLEERGFRCVDLCEPMHRPGDGVLWQMDLFFVPAGNREFASASYE